jgi:signal transduction histidine kinase
MKDDQDLGQSMKTKRLNTKMTIGVLVGVSVIIAISYLTYLWQKEFETAVISSTQQHLLTIAKATATGLEEYITEHLDVLRAVSKNPLFQELRPEYDLLKIFTEEHKKHVDAIYVLDTNGIVLYRYPVRKGKESRVGVNYSDRPGVATVLKEHEPYISEVFHNKSGELSFSLLTPILYEGTVTGIVRWMITLDTVSKSFIQPISIGENGYARLIDNNGVMLAHPKPEHVGKYIMDPRKEAFPDWDWSELEDIVAKMTKGEEGVGFYHSVWWTEEKHEKVKKLTAYAPIHVGDKLWSISVSMGYSEIVTPINRQLRNTYIFLGLVILLFCTGGVMLFRTQRDKAELEIESKYLKEIANSAEALRKAHEELERRVEERTAELVNANKHLEQEIDERKRAEEALRESEARYRGIFENTKNGVAVYQAVNNGEDFIFIDFNRAGENIDKVRRGDLIGKSVLQIFPSIKDFGLFDMIKRVWKAGESEYHPVALYEDDRITGWRDSFVYKLPSGEIVAVYSDETERIQAEEALRQANEELLKEYNQRKILSERLIDTLEKDRRQVAMELHDHVGQTLTSLKMNLEMIHAQLKPTGNEWESQITAAEEKAVQAIKDIKNISHGLRPGILDALGLVSSLRELLDEYKQQMDIEIHFFNRNVPIRLTPVTELTIYRIAQEALLNIIKHAHAKKVFVNLVKKDEVLSLSVEDDGDGFDLGRAMEISKGKGPLGLLIMRERAIQVGGEFTIESRVGRGTHLLVEVPP